MHIQLGQMLCNAVEFKLNLASLVKEETLNKFLINTEKFFNFKIFLISYFKL